MLHQLVEGRLRLGVDEPVVAQLPDAAGDVGRQRVEERLAHPGVVLGLERQRRSFAIDDVVEAFAEFLERAREVEVRLLACAAFAEPGAERVQALKLPCIPRRISRESAPSIPRPDNASSESSSSSSPADSSGPNGSCVSSQRE